MPIISNDIFSNLVRTPNLLNETIELGTYVHVEDEVKTYGENDDKEFVIFTYQHSTNKTMIQFTSFDLQGFYFGTDNSIIALQKSDNYTKDSKVNVIETFEIIGEIIVPKKDRIYPLYSYSGYNQYKIDKESDDEDIKSTSKDVLKATKLKAGFADSHSRKVALKDNLLAIFEDKPKARAKAKPKK